MIIETSHLHKSLQELSCVNKRFRALCAPRLFQKLKISFSKAGFECLKQMSKSPMRQHVRTICYEAPELIDPCLWPTIQKRRYKFCMLTEY